MKKINWIATIQFILTLIGIYILVCCSFTPFDKFVWFSVIWINSISLIFQSIK